MGYGTGQRKIWVWIGVGAILSHGHSFFKRNERHFATPARSGSTFNQCGCTVFNDPGDERIALCPCRIKLRQAAKKIEDHFLLQVLAISFGEPGFANQLLRLVLNALNRILIDPLVGIPDTHLNPPLAGEEVVWVST